MVGFFSGTDAGNANLTVMDGAGVFAYGINTIQVSAGTLIPNGNGKCTIQTGGGGGGGSIGGTISAGQVAFGTALDTIGGDPQFTYNSTTNVLTVSGTVAADTVRLGGATNTPLAANTSGDIIAMGLGANGLLTYASGVLTALTQGFTINDTTTSKAIGNGSELRVASNTAIGQAVSSLGANTAQLEVVLKNTGVVAGSYNPSNITVDAQGRITAATTGNIGMSSWKIRGDTGTTQTINDNDTVIVVGGTGIDTVGGATDQITVNLETIAGVSGSYNPANITVDATGRITAASTASIPTGANPTQTIGASAVNGTATTFMRSDAAPALETTGVSAGSYLNTNITVDATGRITAASSGSMVGGVIVQNSGAPQGTAQTLNFNNNLTATVAAGVATIDASGGGGGGGYPLFKHDQFPSVNNFNPFRLLVNGDSIELGVSTGGDDNTDVSVFTPAFTDAGSAQVISLNAIGSAGTNTGREYIFYGQFRDRGDITQYNFGVPTNTTPSSAPVYVITSMAQILPSPTPNIFQSKLQIATTGLGVPTPQENKVRVIDAGVHSVFNASPVGGQPEPEEPTDVRLLLVVDSTMIDGGRTSNFNLLN